MSSPKKPYGPEVVNGVKAEHSQFPSIIVLADVWNGEHCTATMIKPDLVLTLGDRVEMLCVATACLYLGIPTARLMTKMGTG